LQKNTTSNKRKGFGTGEIKALVVALSLVFCLGFWGVFSRQLMKEAANTAVELSSPEPTTAPAQPTESLVINLPPLPTLISYNGLSKNGQADDPQPVSVVPTAQPVVATVSAAPVTGKILLGGAAPQAPAQAARSSSGRSTVTRTRSSK
jgi:hypothetical protein